MIRKLHNQSIPFYTHTQVLALTAHRLFKETDIQTYFKEYFLIVLSILKLSTDLYIYEGLTVFKTLLLTNCSNEHTGPTL